MKLFRHRRRILAGHGISHQENFRRLQDRLDSLQFTHENLIHLETTSGVDDQGITTKLPGPPDGLAADIHRILVALRRMNRHFQLASQYRQLLDGGGPINIDGNQVRFLAIVFEPPGQLAGGGGLARALKTDQHDGYRLASTKVQIDMAAAQQFHQLLVDNFNHLLTGGQAFQHLTPHCFLGHSGDKIFNHLEVDIGLQQGQSHLAQGFLNIFFVQATMAAQFLEYFLQTIGKIVKHILT